MVEAVRTSIGSMFYLLGLLEDGQRLSADRWFYHILVRCRVGQCLYEGALSSKIHRLQKHPDVGNVAPSRLLGRYFAHVHHNTCMVYFLYGSK